MLTAGSLRSPQAVVAGVQRGRQLYGPSDGPKGSRTAGGLYTEPGRTGSQHTQINHVIYVLLVCLSAGSWLLQTGAAVEEPAVQHTDI